MKIEQSLADYLVNLRYDEIPQSVVEATKAQIINILSAAIGVRYRNLTNHIQHRQVALSTGNQHPLQALPYQFF